MGAGPRIEGGFQLRSERSRTPQRRTTVMVRVRQRVFEASVAAEFRTLHRELIGYFDEMVDHLIADAMRGDGNDETLEQRQIGR